MNDALPGRGAPPWVFLLLYAPFGMSSGFLTVTLAYRLDAAGVGAEAIAGLIALSYLPHTWKFAWAPLVDLVWQRKDWYLLSTTLSAAGTVAAGWFGNDGSQFGLLTAVVLVGNVAVTLSGMSVEALMAHGSDDAAKGRAGGWFQAGNLGGQGLGGGLALWLVQEHGFGTAAAGAALALLSLLCMFALRRCPAPQQPLERASIVLVWHKLRADLLSVVRSRRGLLALLICFLPIGSGAASNLWPVLAGDWHAGASTVALVNGVFGGLASAAGCIAGGYLCDRYDRKAMYCLFGALLAAMALLMGLAARTETNFAVFALAYGFVIGMSYAGFSGVVLEAIGRGAAATKYSLLASLSNMPIAYVTWADGWAYARWGAGTMLQVDAGLGVAGLLLFALIARGSASSGARTASGTHSG